MTVEAGSVVEPAPLPTRTRTRTRVDPPNAAADAPGAG